MGIVDCGLLQKRELAGGASQQAKLTVELAPELPTEVAVGLDAWIRRDEDQGMLVPVKGGNGDIHHSNQGGTAKAPAFVSERETRAGFFYISLYINKRKGDLRHDAASQRSQSDGTGSARTVDQLNAWGSIASAGRALCRRGLRCGAALGYANNLCTARAAGIVHGTGTAGNGGAKR